MLPALRCSVHAVGVFVAFFPNSQWFDRNWWYQWMEQRCNGECACRCLCLICLCQKHQAKVGLSLFPHAHTVNFILYVTPLNQHTQFAVLIVSSAKHNTWRRLDIYIKFVHIFIMPLLGETLFFIRSWKKNSPSRNAVKKKFLRLKSQQIYRVREFMWKVFCVIVHCCFLNSHLVFFSSPNFLRSGWILREMRKTLFFSIVFATRKLSAECMRVWSNESARKKWKHQLY